MKGKTLTDKSDIMERWTEYCSELYKNEDYNNTVEELMKELEWILPLQKDDMGDYILKEEVEKAITRMKNNKSPGIDEITSEMIKAGRDCLTDHLHHLCNLIWKDGRMPKEWTKSVLVTIQTKIPKVIRDELRHCPSWRKCHQLE